MGIESVQACYQSGRYLACIRAAEQALPELSGQKRAESLWLAGKAALHLSMWQEAVQYITDVVANSEGEARDSAIIGLAHALIEYGEVSEAEGHLLRLLSDDALSPFHRAHALHHLGLAYERRRHYNAAVSVYEQAADTFVSIGRRREALTSLQNASFVALVEGVPAGEALLQKAASLVPSGTELLRTHQLALEAYQALLQGRNHDAILGAEEILQPNHLHSTDWDRALGAYVAARVAASEGQVLIARALADKARNWAPASRDVRLMNLVNTLNDLEGEV